MTINQKLAEYFPGGHAVVLVERENNELLNQELKKVEEQLRVAKSAGPQKRHKEAAQDRCESPKDSLVSAFIKSMAFATEFERLQGLELFTIRDYFLNVVKRDNEQPFGELGYELTTYCRKNQIDYNDKITESNKYPRHAIETVITKLGA